MERMKNMVKYTPNYNLGKPEGTDMYSVLPQNANMDIIDNALKENQQLITVHESESVEDLNGVHGLTIESGNFTPYFYGTTNAGANTTYLIQTGTYYKINNLVKIDLTLQVNIKDTNMSGNLYIGGIPFSAAAAHCSIGGYQSITLSDGYSELLASILGTRIILRECGSNKTENIVVATKITNTSFIRLSATYKLSE